VTARALALYDPELPKAIAEVWGIPNPVTVVSDEQEQEGANGKVRVSGSDKVLQEAMKTYSERVSAIEAELARRAGGGTPSDLVWDEWVRNEHPA
jgi:hypothetical protein